MDSSSVGTAPDAAREGIGEPVAESTEAKTGTRLTKSAYAKHARVHPSTVTRWVQNGRIPVEPDGLIDPVAADRQRNLTESPLPHHQARKAQLDADKDAAQDGAREPPDPDQQLDAAAIARELKLQTLRLQRAKAEAAALDLDQRAGLVLLRQDVERVMQDIGANTRRIVGNLAPQLAPRLAAHGGDVAALHREIEEEARTLLQTLSAELRRSADKLSPAPDHADITYD